MIPMCQYWSVLSSILIILISDPLFAASAAEQPFGVYLATPRVLDTVPQSIKATRISAANQDAELRIETLKNDEGPYNPALAPLLTAAGSRALELGDTAKALMLYRQALYNLRVNNGLYSEAQLSLLQSIMSLLRLSGDLEALDHRVDYFYRLMGSGQPPWNTAKIEASLKYLEWTQEKLSHQSWDDKEREAIALVDDGERLIASICQSPDFAADWCAAVTLRHIASLYLIQWRVKPSAHIPVDSGFRDVPDWRAAESAERFPVLDRLQMMRHSLKTKGAVFLTDALSVTNEKLMIELALADWYWFLGDVAKAKGLYAELYQREPQLFSTPTPLPAEPTLKRDPALAEDSARVDFSAEVSVSGTPKRVVATYVGEEGKDWESRGLRHFRTLRFRPAMDTNGQFVAASIALSLIVMRE